MIKVIFHGFGTPLYGPIPTQPPTFLSPAAKSGSVPVSYNPARARALLQDAGYTTGPDGIAQKSGQRLSFEALLVSGSDTGPLIAQFVQSNLAAIGIDLHIRQLAFNQVAALLGGPPQGWQAAFIGWAINGYPDGQQIYATDGGSNVSHYSDPHMDQLVTAVNFAADRQPLFAYQDYAAAEQPSIFLSDGARPVIARRGIAGVRDFINPDGALYPEDLTLTDPNFCHAPHHRDAP
jgi:peptide/nickel transport system substrate-binding protein